MLLLSGQKVWLLLLISAYRDGLSCHPLTHSPTLVRSNWGLLLPHLLPPNVANRNLTPQKILCCLKGRVGVFLVFFSSCFCGTVACASSPGEGSNLHNRDGSCSSDNEGPSIRWATRQLYVCLVLSYSKPPGNFPRPRLRTKSSNSQLGKNVCLDLLLLLQALALFMNDKSFT